MRVVVSTNPRSGAGRGSRVAQRVVARLRAAGHDVVELAGSSAQESRSLLHAALAEPADAVIAVGGDGGVNLALGVLLERAPHIPLGIVAAGSGNDLAYTLALPRHHHEAQADWLLAALERLAVGGGTRRIDAGRIRPLAPSGEPAPDAASRYFLSVASGGVDAAINARADALPWARSPLRYVIGLAAELVRFRGYAIRVVADGVDLGDCATIVSVCNSGRIGGGMLIAPDADLTDALFDVVVAPKVTRRLLTRIFPRVYRGTHVRHPLVRVTRAAAVDVVPLGPTEAAGRAPAPAVYADGEHICGPGVRIDVLPGAVAVLS